MRPWVVVVPAAAVAVAGGCTQPDLSEASLVEGLRLLGVQAEPPEAAAGETVVLTAWPVDTRGGAVDVTWSACTLPSNGEANAGCTDGSGRGLVGIGSGTSITMTVPPLDPASYGPPDATDGVYLPIVAHLAGGDDALDAVYRLRVRVPELVPKGCTLLPPYPPHCGPNQNPSYTELDPLTGDPDEAIPTTEGASWALEPVFDGGGEEYAIPGTTMPTAFERLTTQWFASAGTFPDTPVGGTGVQKWDVDRSLPPSGGTIDLWIVGHDDRGGTTMMHRIFVRQ